MVCSTHLTATHSDVVTAVSVASGKKGIVGLCHRYRGSAVNPSSGRCSGYSPCRGKHSRQGIAFFGIHVF